MMTLPIGFFAVIGLVVASLKGADIRIFLNWHAILLVIGGTAGILLFTSPWNEVVALFKSLIDLFRGDFRITALHNDVIKLSKDRKSETSEKHPLLVRAKDLWNQGVDPEIFEVLLKQILDESCSTTERARDTMRNLSKYPPALGMTGTVMGLVTMFSHLTPDKQHMLGASLALAMTATFYGLVLANAVVLPFADRLASLHLSHTQFNEHIFRVLVLINRGEAPSLIEETIHAAA